MKKISFILVAVLLVSLLSAIDFEKSGELRTRAAMYNDTSEYDGGFIDSRFQLRLNANLHPDLQIGTMFEIGNIVWGDFGGFVGQNAVNIKTNNLYVDYMIHALDAKLRFGRQYWADHASLILDDDFNGLMLNKEDFLGFKTDLGFIKANERFNDRKDDYNVFLLNMQTEGDLAYGWLASYGKDQVSRAANFTAMPYVTANLGEASIDATLFVDYQTQRGLEDRIGYGTSLKAAMGLGDIKLGADLLYANEEGLTTLSPYYMNGLYLYGYGALHDGVAIHWNDGYSAGNGSGFLSLAGNARMPLSEKMEAFGAAGFAMTNDDYLGAELNGGLEYEAIKDLFKVGGFGALAFPESGADMNYLLGINATITF